jgi:hypothetical protein
VGFVDFSSIPEATVARDATEGHQFPGGARPIREEARDMLWVGASIFRLDRALACSRYKGWLDALAYREGSGAFVCYCLCSWGSMWSIWEVWALADLCSAHAWDVATVSVTQCACCALISKRYPWVGHIFRPCPNLPRVGFLSPKSPPLGRPPPKFLRGGLSERVRPKNKGGGVCFGDSGGSTPFPPPRGGPHTQYGGGFLSPKWKALFEPFWGSQNTPQKDLFVCLLTKQRLHRDSY